MAKLEITLTKEKFEALGEPLKEFYKENEEGQYELEGIGSIQRALDAEKSTKTKAIEAATKAAAEKARAEALKDFEGIDPVEAKALKDAAAQAEADKLTKKGDWDKLKEQLDERHNKELEKAKGDYDGLLRTLKAEAIKNLATKKGVLPDRVRSAMAEGDFDNILELESTDHGFNLKKKGGIGDEPEIDAIFTDLKSKASWLFAQNGASGSGASGSNGNGGHSAAKTWTRGEWEAASTAERTEFTNAKGEVVDQ